MNVFNYRGSWLERARFYQASRFRAMSKNQKRIYTSAVYTVALFAFCALFVPYARLWFYWFEVAIGVHFFAACAVISYFMRPSAPHWVPAVELPPAPTTPRRLTKTELVRITDAASNWAHSMQTEQRERYKRELIGVLNTVINNPEPQPQVEDQKL